MKTASVSNTNTVKEEETVIDDSLVKKLVEKINFPTYATASIYNTGKFNLDTIPNDLILRLGWSKIDSSNKKLKTDTEVYTQTSTKEIMKDSITKIFGSKVKYTDKTFTNIDVMTFNGYNENRGDISYSNNLYTADYIEGGGGDVPFIHQEVQKVLKNNDKIELYVKTAFVDTEYIGNIDDFEYIIYQNFENNKFEGKVAEVTATEFIK